MAESCCLPQGVTVSWMSTHCSVLHTVSTVQGWHLFPCCKRICVPSNGRMKNMLKSLVIAGFLIETYGLRLEDGFNSAVLH